MSKDIDMKKFIVFAVSLLLPLMVLGQAQIDTKKMKIRDFTQKVTKIVLTACLSFRVLHFGGI